MMSFILSVVFVVCFFIVSNSHKLDTLATIKNPRKQIINNILISIEDDSLQEMMGIVGKLSDAIKSEGDLDLTHVNIGINELDTFLSELLETKSHLSLDNKRIEDEIENRRNAYNTLLRIINDLVSKHKDMEVNIKQLEINCEQQNQFYLNQISALKTGVAVLINHLEIDVTSESFLIILAQLESLETNKNNEYFDIRSAIANLTETEDKSSKEIILSSLVKLLNQSLIETKDTLRDHKDTCGLQKRSLNNQNLNIISEINSTFETLSIEETGIKNLLNEKGNIDSLINYVNDMILDVETDKSSIKEALNRRERERNDIKGKAESILSKSSILMGQAESKNTSGLSSILCLDEEGRVCSGHGKCFQNGICQCDRGFYGIYCENEVKCTLSEENFNNFNNIEIKCPQNDNNNIFSAKVDQICQINCKSKAINSIENKINELKCLSNGKWDKPVPYCGNVECNLSEIVIPEYSEIYCEGNLPGNHCFFRCESGTTLTNKDIRNINNSVICLANGKWSNFPRNVCEKVLCNKLETIQNGFIDCQNFRYPTECRFGCNDGYKLIGSPFMRCLSNSSWSHSAYPYCEKIECPSLNSIKHGNYHCSGSSIGDECEVLCEKGYRLDHDAERKCLPSGSWSGIETKSCIPEGCKSPLIAKNGVSYCPDGLSIGSKCDYVCDTGDIKTSNATIICTNEGIWKGDYNGCEMSNCDLPPKISNGNLECSKLCSESSSIVSSECNLKCDDGFELIGNGKFVCEKSKEKWEFNSYCKSIGCDLITPVENSFTVCSGNMPGSICKHYCNYGYTHISPKVHTCSGDRVWVGSFAENSNLTESCIKTQCGPPPSPSNGFFNCTGTSFNDICSLNCPGGFILGESDYICNSDGSWSGNAVCVIEKCDTLDVPEHASIQCTGNDVGSECDLECRKPYQAKSGNTKRICAAGGKWTGSDLVCEIAHCNSLPQIDYGLWNCLEPHISNIYNKLTENQFGYLSRCVLSCDQQHETNIPNWICNEDGIWESENDPSVKFSDILFSSSCQKPDCGFPPMIENGKVECSQDGNCVIQCNEFYNFQGNENRLTCGVDGVWNSHNGKCSKTECGSPPSVTDSGLMQCAPAYGSKEITINDSKYFKDSSCTYICGSESNSVHSLICSEDGQWRPEIGEYFPTCSMNCGVPLFPQNGSIICNQNHSECHVICDSGFQLVGEEKITCKGNGIWSQNSSQYKCEPLHCYQVPPQIENGKIHCDSNFFGSNCEYTCDPGFTLMGPRSVSCLEDGEWGITTEITSYSATKTRCELQTCDLNEIFEKTKILSKNSEIEKINVELKCETTKTKQICSPFCPNGYKLSGSEIVTCDSFGHWSDSNIFCELITCPSQPKVKNGQVTCSGHQLNDFCQLTCDEGFKPLENQKSVCVEGGVWKGGNLICVQN